MSKNVTRNKDFNYYQRHKSRLIAQHLSDYSPRQFLLDNDIKNILITIVSDCSYQVKENTSFVAFKISYNVVHTIKNDVFIKETDVHSCVTDCSTEIIRPNWKLNPYFAELLAVNTAIKFLTNQFKILKKHGKNLTIDHLHIVFDHPQLVRLMDIPFSKSKVQNMLTIGLYTDLIELMGMDFKNRVFMDFCSKKKESMFFNKDLKDIDKLAFITLCQEKAKKNDRPNGSSN